MAPSPGLNPSAMAATITCRECTSRLQGRRCTAPYGKSGELPGVGATAIRRSNPTPSASQVDFVVFSRPALRLPMPDYPLSAVLGWRWPSDSRDGRVSAGHHAARLREAGVSENEAEKLSRPIGMVALIVYGLAVAGLAWATANACVEWPGRRTGAPE